MTKEEIKQLGESEDIKFIYKIPCSLFDNGYEYIIISINDININRDNIRTFNVDEWFLRIKAGSFLPYICGILPKSEKLKEFINIYNKPDILNTRQFINTLKNEKELIQECLWAEQFVKEGKVNRIDVFKNKYFNSKDALKRFYEISEPIYKIKLMNCDKK